MPSPFAKVIWNKFEAALLVNTYERVSNGELARKDAISKLSKRLRYRMIRNGIDVNEKYRNENGIQLQMSIMEHILTDGVKGLAGHSQLFEEIARLVKDNHDEYDELLKEAIRMYPEPLACVEEQTDTVYENTGFAKEAISKGDQFLESIMNVLTNKFPKGMRLSSPIDKRRFRQSYKELVGEGLDVDDEELSRILTSCSIESNGKIYVAAELIPSDLQKEIVSFINTAFNSGKGYIFYESLFRHFKAQLLDTPIASVPLLCTWLQYKYNKGMFFDKEYMTNDRFVDIDIDKEVISYMREQWLVMNEDDVVEGLNYLPEGAVRTAFNRNQNVLIAATRGMRFHIDKFEISEDELNEIIFLIDTTIGKYQFMGADELFECIRQKLPQVIANNADIPELGIRKALAVRLSDRFDFNNAVISQKGVKLSARDALLAFAKSHDEFTLEEIDNLAQSLGTVINYHLVPLLEYSVRINEKEFVSRNKVHFDVESIDEYLLKHINHEVYSVPLRSIHNFATFPECNFPWTPRLLESYLLAYSNKLTLYLSDYLNKNNICGVVSYKVKEVSFNFLVEIALAKNNVSLNKKDALDYLATEGYIVQRRNSDIEEILACAKLIREKDNSNDKII